MFVTLDTFQLEMSPSKDRAPKNMVDMSLTLHTFHLEMSALNDAMPQNKALMSATRDMSHSPIGPCRPSEQAPVFDCFRHASTAHWSSKYLRGENALRLQTADDIDPDEPTNMSRLVAFERTQAPQSLCEKDVAPANMRSM